MSKIDKRSPLDKDVVIVGGGMVGAATAIGLANLGLTVAVVEMSEPKPFFPEQALDLRVSAISVASEALLQRLGALEAVHQMRSAPYVGLETWELDGCLTSFDAQQVAQSHLGHIVENRIIQLALWQQMQRIDTIEFFCPNRVSGFSRIEQAHDSLLHLNKRVQVTLEDETTLNCKLLIGADGANSQVRQWANIGISGWEYSQSALLINIKTAEPQQDITWQQFTPSGPRALLPLAGNNASLVWYDNHHRIAQLVQLPPKTLAKEIVKAFPSRLATGFEVVKTASFPLARRHAQQYVQDNVAILGDAAHTINPLAGQGVNIGFKDVEQLIDTVCDALYQDKPWWSATALTPFERKRYRENCLMMSTMDLFYILFSNEKRPLQLARNALLKLANIDSPLKRKVLKYAMGCNKF